jgi:RsiW-degrading membrane proteinase PrsW (M82 family)
MKVNFTHLIAFIWACLISFLWLLFMTGCSASYHYGKAIKKGVQFVPTTDTIEIQKIDSVFINNEWVKVVTKYDTIIRYNEVFVPKTRYQIKTEYKLKRDSIEVIKYKTKIEYKTVKKKYNFPWKILIICFAIGFVIALIKYRRL